MTKEERHAIRKKCKEYRIRRTDCREKDDMNYFRGLYKSDRYTVLIRNSAYYEFDYEIVVYNKYTKKIANKQCTNREAIFRIAMLWISEDYHISYHPNLKWI